MKFAVRRALVAAVFIVVQTVAGCGGDSTSPVDNSAASITLSEQAATLVPQATIALDATVHNQQGAVLEQPVTWSSSDDSRATVTQNGTVTGVSAGSATITATRDGKSADASITVKEGAVVGSAGGSVTALGGRVELVVPAGVLSSQLMVTIDNGNGSPADAKLVPGTAIDLGPDGQTFSAPLQLKLKYNAAQLPAGASEGDLRIHRASGGSWELVSGGQVNTSTKTVSANLSSFSQYAILPRSALQLSSTSLSFDAMQGGTASSQQINIANSGSGTLTGLSLGTFVYGSGASGWIQSASLSGTSSPATLSVQVNAASLAAGNYSATIPVICASSNETRNLQIAFSVTSGPSIAISSTSLAFAAEVNGSNPASQVVTITNAGGGTLSGLNVGTIVYGPGASGWLQASLSGTSATPSATLTIQPSGGALPAGVYNAAVPVESPGAANSPRIVTVSFTISSSTRIALSSSTLLFTASNGAPDPESKFIDITNSGVGTLTGLEVGTITYGSATGWIQSATLNTTTAPARLTVQPVTGQLPPGNYSATIPISSSAASNSPQNVTVTFSVQAASSCVSDNAPPISIGETVNGILTTSDCQMIVDLPGNHYVDFYKLTVTTAALITINLSSSFDTYLILHDFTTGAFIEANDDVAPGDFNSQIISVLLPGTYLLTATSFEELTTGPYVLAIPGIGGQTSASIEPITDELFLCGSGVGCYSNSSPFRVRTHVSETALTPRRYFSRLLSR